MTLFKLKDKSIFILLVVVAFFFWPFFLKGRIPIPADTILGLYHPWRDVVWDNLTAGVPFKNFLITDPVRQQYPWRELAMDVLQQGQLPLWNPYTFSGSPLLANAQSAVFYPLNILYLFLPSPVAWTIQVILQPILSTLFMFFYLRHLQLRSFAAFFGGFVFAFSGFSIAWLTWNTMLHSLLWLPLILLSIDRVLYVFSNSQISKLQLKIQNFLVWSMLLIFSLSSSFFAGHLQVFLYVFLTSLAYLIYRIFSLPKVNRLKIISLFTIHYLLLTMITSIQWIPTLKFISLSARSVDQSIWQKPDWFLPWQHLIQFIAPDFFGNPATLNYWGVWNYGEFVGYIGILPLIFAIFSLLNIKRGLHWDKRILFFSATGLLALLFSLPTPLAKIPFVLKIPVIATLQPSRLISIIDFCLAVLAAVGVDYFLSEKTQKRWIHLFPGFLLALTMGVLWFYVLYQIGRGETLNNWLIAMRNLILPTILITISLVTLIPFFLKIVRLYWWWREVLLFFFSLIVIFDLFRFGWKFTPFTPKDWIYPKTEIIKFLKSQPGVFRLMSTDSRILPPNFSVAFRLQTVDGYDPLYLKRYGEYVGMWIRGKPDLSPFNFNRIITPNLESHLADIANVRFILSLKDENSAKLHLVFKEGETRLYENTQALPRVFLVERVESVDSNRHAAASLFDPTVDWQKVAIVEKRIKDLDKEPLLPGETAEIVKYAESEVIIKTKTNKRRFLVLTDNFYPDWQAYIDGVKTEIYRTNYTFRGIIVPEGVHQIHFTIKKLF